MNENDKQAAQGKDILSPPHPRHFGIPAEHWEAAKNYAEYLTQNKQAQPVALPKFNCWSTSEGDSWFDHPADAQAIYERLGGFAKVGDEYELLAGWRSVTARYRIVSIDGDDFEVECVSHTHTTPAAAINEQLLKTLKSWYEQEYGYGVGPTQSEIEVAIRAAEAEKAKGGV